MFEDSVTIVLDKERHLKLTLGGMKRFREATGIDLLRGIGDISNLSEGDMAAFIWACLLPEDRKITLEDVGYMLNPTKLNEITEAMIKVWGLTMPEGDGTPGPNQLNRPPG